MYLIRLAVPAIALAFTTFVTTTVCSADTTSAPESLMVTPGKQIVSKTFDKPTDVDKESMGFRKQTQFKVEDGQLKVLPPVIALADTKSDNEWASSSMARAGLLNLPAEYICQLRWKYNQSKNPKYESKGSAYIDLGHRCIRVTFTRAGTILKLENHLVGNDAAETSKLLGEYPELKLEPEKWYDITVEVKGDEVVFQIDGTVLYGKDALIAKERANTVNIDSGGDGYALDNIRVWEAGDYKSDWNTKRTQLSN